MVTAESIADKSASTRLFTKVLPSLRSLPMLPKAVEKPTGSDTIVEESTGSDTIVEESTSSDKTIVWTTSAEGDDGTRSVDSWGELLHPKPCKNDDDDDDDTDGTPILEKIDQGIRRNWESRHLPGQYTEVIVLLIRWEKHNFGQKLEDTVEHYRYVFECLYKYTVWDFKIPAKKPHLALTTKLLELVKRDSPETLFLIWYDGHGREHIDRRGSPRWCSHHDKEECQTVDSSIISTTLSDCEADILLINNACQTLTCDRFYSKGVVESISASAFSTSTYGSMKPEDLSLSMTWAAYTILCDYKSVNKGITVAELHRQICLGVQWCPESHPDSDADPVYWKANAVRTQPVYTRLSADKPGAGGRTRSIVLCEQRFPRAWNGQVLYPEMQVKLQITNPDKMNPKEWIDWLQSAPSCVDYLSLEEGKRDFEEVV
ncbi:hypothetical protein F4803DRAFT_574429 [Xylaria telfairii]|nr:hypothetical protein F4803DRAFT_574429 [Xylaria telfairii]